MLKSVYLSRIICNSVSNILGPNFHHCNRNLLSKSLSGNIRSSLISIPIVSGLFHTGASLRGIEGLDEFFDDKKNWGVEEVKVGRSWKKEELRLKSHEDLHKLWFVLLKEKNMLLTMEKISKDEFKLFPNPERIDKVEESMANLETVVKERDDAYLLLETGEKSGRPSGPATDWFGRTLDRQFKEYSVPSHMNPMVYDSPFYKNPIRTRFSRLLREKENRRISAERGHNFRYVCKILKFFPNVDIEALKQKYPDVDVEKARRHKSARGNHQYNYG